MINVVHNYNWPITSLIPIYPDGNFTPEVLELLSHNALHWINFLWIVNSQWCLYSNNSIQIFCSTLSQKYQQADWSMLKNNEKATLIIYMPYQVQSQWSSLHLFYFVFAVEGQEKCHAHHYHHLTWSCGEMEETETDLHDYFLSF